MKKIKGYKAFHKDMTCNGFKFKEDTMKNLFNNPPKNLILPEEWQSN